MPNLTLKQASTLLQSKQISAVELATDYLNAIDQINPKINAYIHLDKEKTLAEAHDADKILAQGNAHALTGVPIAYKDNFCQLGWHTSCSSRILSNFVAPYTATVVQNLLNKGMVTLGRVNMDEFAMGSTTENSFFGTTHNPWNIQHTSGGSSGGSAAAVAARLAPVALGSDTGGSIRQPASHCGVTGLKPTYGVVSRYGMVAYASSLDQAGVLAQTAEDCALLLNVMASFDERDSTSIQRPNEDYRHHLNTPLKGLKIGLPKEYFSHANDQSVQTALNNIKTLLQQQGAETVEVSLPQTQLSIPAYYVLASAEASTNLSRYDGVRYGYRTPSFNNLDEMYGKTRAEGFGTEVKRRIMIGTYVLSHGYYDAFYVKAQKLRRLVADDFQAAFKQCDVILAPNAPTAAPTLGSKNQDPVQVYLSDIYTIAVNLAGLPALSLPAGFSDHGLPIGVQLIGNHFTEATLLGTAHQIQLASDWHLQTPTLSA